MIDMIGFIIFIVLFLSLFLNTIKLKFKNKKLSDEIFKSSIEKSVLLEKVLELSNEKQNRELEKSDDFLKFISQSRDWAFEYIENVQAGIDSFIKDVGPTIEHFDEYGDVIHTPLTDSMKTISNAYKELKTLIPEDYGKIDK